jgi:hypothetical protein
MSVRIAVIRVSKASANAYSQNEDQHMKIATFEAAGRGRLGLVVGHSGPERG